MSRIIAGTLRGRRLAVPRAGTRPTSDRVREALFSALTASGDVDGAIVLDLFAGSGALGFEALSRGARRLLAVEASRTAADLVRANARALGVRAEVHAGKVSTFLAKPPPVAVDLVLMDPPYDYAGVDADLRTLATGGWLAPHARVVVERSTRTPAPVFPPGLADVQSRRYGETTVWFARAEGAPG